MRLQIFIICFYVVVRKPAIVNHDLIEKNTKNNSTDELLVLHN